MFKSKGFIIGILVTLIIALSGITFAYWANNVKDAEIEVDGLVEIGTGKEVVTHVNVTAQSGKTLVPVGRVDDSNEEAVEVVHLTYTVTWTEDRNAADGTLGSLAAEISNIAIGGNNELGNKYANVEVITATPQGIALNGEAVTVTVKVTLNEPVSRADYLLVAGKDITFDIKFAVTVA